MGKIVLKRLFFSILSPVIVGIPITLIIGIPAAIIINGLMKQIKINKLSKFVIKVVLYPSIGLLLMM